MTLALGIDVGGTSLRAALVDENGALVHSAKRALAERSPDAVLEQVAELVSGLGPDLKRAPIAVGLAALLLPKKGLVANGPAFGWRNVPFGEMLANRFGRPVRLINDLDAITVGEAVLGAGQGSHDVMCVFVGTGVGMGVVSQGVVIEGADGLATELGHIKVESPVDGRLCGCGERGCLEAYTSGFHLPKLLFEKAAQGLASPFLARTSGDPTKVNAATLEAAAAEGDPAARALWDDIGRRLGIAVANAITLFNPRVLVLGGGVLVLAPSLRARLVEGVQLAAARSHLAGLSIRDTMLGDDAGLVGAGLLAHESAAALMPR